MPCACNRIGKKLTFSVHNWNILQKLSTLWLRISVTRFKKTQNTLSQDFVLQKPKKPILLKIAGVGLNVVEWNFPLTISTSSCHCLSSFTFSPWESLYFSNMYGLITPVLEVHCVNHRVTSLRLTEQLSSRSPWLQVKGRAMTGEGGELN